MILNNPVPPEYINKIICADALKGQKLLPNNCVDMAVTSPPYWGHRVYGKSTEKIWDGAPNCEHEWREIPFGGRNKREVDIDPKFAEGLRNPRGMASQCFKCGAWKGQLGLEPTVEMYVNHLCDIFDETKRILKDTGSLWVNIGDAYNNNPSNSGDSNLGNAEALVQISRMIRVQEGIPVKSLCCIPERFVIEMVQRGWIKRNTLVWYKPNAMPSSANDRFTVDFEYLYFFTKKPDYYFEQQLEQYSKPINRWSGTTLKTNGSSRWDKGTGQDTYRDRDLCPNPEGRNKRCVWEEKEYGTIVLKNVHGEEVASASVPQSEISKYLKTWMTSDMVQSSVWEINTKGIAEAHYAAFPPELIEIPIKAGCPKDVCKKCWRPRENIYQHNELSDEGKAEVEILNEKPYSIKEREGMIAVRNLPQLNVLKDYLTTWRKVKGITVETIEEIMQSQAPHHWFSGESYPTKEDWMQIKGLLGFDNHLDEVMTTEYFKPAEKMLHDYTIIGRTDCGCNAGFSSGTVLDMFMGSGTTAVVAKELGMNFMGFDMNAEYIDTIAIPRINRIRGVQKKLGAF